TVVLRSTAEDWNDGSNIAAHYGAPDWGTNGFVGGCHGDHGYWNMAGDWQHALGKPFGPRDDLLSGGLAYVFPPRYRPDGAEGQPKIPVLVKRHYDRASSPRDPWDLTIKLRFDPGA